MDGMVCTCPRGKAVLTFLQVAIVLSPSSQSEWLPTQIRLPTDSSPEQGPGTARRPRIGYGAIEETGDVDSVRQEVNDLNKDSRTGAHVEFNRTRSAGFLNETARWRETDD